MRSEADIFAALSVEYREPRERNGKMDIISLVSATHATRTVKAGKPFFLNQGGGEADDDASDTEGVPALMGPVASTEGGLLLQL